MNVVKSIWPDGMKLQGSDILEFYALSSKNIEKYEAKKRA